MTTETKAILRRSINEFLSVSEQERDNMILHVKKELQRHRKGLSSIGMGLANDYVVAGEIFLRIYDVTTTKAS